MNARQILSAGVIGTTFMTLFSYLMSYKKRKNFKEPETLSDLAERLFPDVKRKYIEIACWNVHYAVGVFFAAIYAALWEQGKLKPGIKSALLLGAASGAFAILVWKSVFKVHPDPPPRDFKRYYGQLFTAHLIFGLTAYTGYKMGWKLMIS